MLIAASAIAAIAAIAPTTASAHAVVLSSQPATNAIVAPGVLGVRLQFSSRVDRERSRLTLIDPAGKENALAIVAGDPPGVLSAHARVGATGRWTVRWQVLSLDGHVTRGDVPFTVNGGGAGG